VGLERREGSSSDAGVWSACCLRRPEAASHPDGNIRRGTGSQGTGYIAVGGSDMKQQVAGTRAAVPHAPHRASSVYPISIA